MRIHNENFQLGKNALESNRNAEALDYLLPCAKSGDAEAQAIVGFLYFFGQSIERDIERAIYWLVKAFEQGRGEAAHNLGTLYLMSDPEMPIDRKKSQYWYLKAKELGFVVAPDEWYDKLKT